MEDTGSNTSKAAEIDEQSLNYDTCETDTHTYEMPDNSPEPVLQKEITNKSLESVGLDSESGDDEQRLGDQSTSVPSAEYDNSESLSDTEVINPAKLFLGGLDYATTEQSIKEHFDAICPVVDVLVMTDKFTGKSRGFGFVTLDNVEIAKKLVNTRRIIEGKEVDVRRAIPRSTSRQDSIADASATSSSDTNFNSKLSNTVPEQSPSADNSGITDTSEAVNDSTPLKLSSLEASKREKNKVANRKVFIGGLHSNVTDVVLREYFEKFGPVQESVVLMDRETKRSRGFGFLTFDDPVTVNAVLDQPVHQILGKKVDVKRAESREQMANKNVPHVRPRVRRRMESANPGLHGRHFEFDQMGMAHPMMAGPIPFVISAESLPYMAQMNNANQMNVSPHTMSPGTSSMYATYPPAGPMPNYTSQPQFQAMYGVYPGWHGGNSLQPMYYSMGPMSMPGVPVVEQPWQHQQPNPNQPTPSFQDNAVADTSITKPAIGLARGNGSNRQSDSENTILQSISPPNGNTTVQQPSPHTEEVPDPEIDQKLVVGLEAHATIGDDIKSLPGRHAATHQA